MYKRIRDLREDNDLRQKDIAEILEITTQQYQLYESGKRELPMYHFIRLAKFYNVSLDYIAGLINDPKGIGGTPYKISKNITINNQGGNNKINIKN